jgi:hypothetical protein
VPGAYLEADMTKRVLMRLGSWRKSWRASTPPSGHQKPDGTFVVVLNKACTDASSRPRGTRCCAECSSDRLAAANP